MSDTPAGEIAARVASEALEEFVERAESDFDLERGPVARKVVEKAMDYALMAVVDAERTEPDFKGLATTVTMLLAHGNLGLFGHCGDSRAYLIRRGRARQLTVDDEWTEAVAGAREEPAEFDVFAVELEPGDTIVLCTDGAEQVVQDAAIVRVAGTLSPQVLASRIVAAAHRRTPDQDATAVVVRMRGHQEPGWLELSEPYFGTRFGHTLQVS